jgi:hypothetical protein
LNIAIAISLRQSLIVVSRAVAVPEFITIEVRWNSERGRYDVVRKGAPTYFHRLKVGAIALARMIARDLIEAGHQAEIIVVEADGSRVKEKI